MIATTDYTQTVRVAVVQAGAVQFDLDLGEIARGKFDFDAVGHYARPDVFQLQVNEAPACAVTRRG